jgi:3-oxoacyl-[acyl-carrier protein] reductase
MPEHYWDMVLGINLQAIINVDAVLDAENIINEHGRVICLCSIGGIAGNRGQTNYGATKAGLIGFVERRGTTARDRGVTVNAVAPGFIETRMTAEMPIGMREAGRRMSSLAQGGEPRDVAEAITFLATPGAGGISGNVLRVCGQSLIGA